MQSVTSSSRQECASLRLELSQRHSEDSRTALNELASLKDSAMVEARNHWEKERERLLKRVIYNVYLYMYRYIQSLHVK